MKTLYALIVFVILSSSLSAGQIQPPSFLVKKWARIMNLDREHKVLHGINYKSIAKHDPKWTEAKIKTLFKSIDLDAVKFLEHKISDPILTMTDPLKVKFTFERRHQKAPPEIKHAVTTFYWLVKIDLVAEK